MGKDKKMSLYQNLRMRCKFLGTSRGLLLPAFFLIVFTTAYYLLFTIYHASAAPPPTPGYGSGAIGVGTSNNLGIGAPAKPETKFLIVASSTASSEFALKVLKPNEDTLLLVRNDGMVGIATSNPAYVLDVVGTIRGTTVLGNFAGTVPAANVTQGTFNSGNYYFPASVGIGTTGPFSKLHVDDNTNNSAIEVRNYAGGFDIVNRAQVAGVYALLRLQSWAGTTLANSDGSYIQSIGNNNNDIDLAFGKFLSGAGQNYEYLRIKNSGNVGIGTAAPISPLQVVGTATFGNGGAASGTVGAIQITGNAGSPVSGRLTFGTDGTGWQFRVAQNQGGTVTDILTIATGGNVGIGDTSPATKLEVVGNVSSTGLCLGGTCNTSWPAGGGAVSTSSAITALNFPYWANVNGGLMGTSTIYYSSGNIGIGTTGPTAKLEIVGGNLKIDQGGGSGISLISRDGTDLVIGTDGAGTNGKGVYLKYYSGTGWVTGLSLLNTTGGANSNIVLLPGGGNVGIGMTPTYALDVNGTIRGTTLMGSWAGTIPASNVTQGTFNGGNYYFPASVGIGTTAPAAPLNVKRGTNPDSTGQPSGNFAAIVYNAVNSSGENGLLVKNNWNAIASTPFEVGLDFVGGAYKSFLKVDGAGNVGIGTAAPGAKLHLYSGGGDTLLYVQGTSGNRQVLDLYTSGGVDGGVVANSGGAALWGIPTNTFGVGPNTSHPLVFITGSAERMRIDTVGNVGIGTASPGRPLDVQDTYTNAGGNIIQTIINKNATANGTYYNQGISSQSNIVINSGVTDSGYYLGFDDGVLRSSASDAGTLATMFGHRVQVGHYTGTATARLTTNVVGVEVDKYYMNGTISNLYGVKVDGTGGGTVTNNYDFYGGDSNASNYFAGKVGIGTTAPSVKFQVNGGISRFAGDTAGYLDIYNVPGAAEGAEIKLVSNGGANYYIENYSGTLRGINSARSAATFTIDQSGNLYVSGNITCGGSCGGLSGGGTVNYVGKFTGTGTIGNSQIFDDGSIVTIPNRTQITDGVASADTASYGTFGVTRTASANTLSYIDMTRAGSAVKAMGIDSSNRWVFGLPTAGTQIISTPQMVIDPGGNVGIGETNPGEKLDVVGNLEVNGIIYGQRATGAGDVLFVGNDSKLVDIDTANTTGIYGIQNSTVGSIKLGSGGGTISGYNSNIGIGTASPGALLNIVAANQGPWGFSIRNNTFSASEAGAFRIYQGDVGVTHLYNNNIDAIDIDTAGKVGIGTAGPGYKLEVAGDVYANGGWLRSSGNAGWYSETWGGGWYMSDANWLRTYNDKSVWTNTGLLGSQGGLTVGYGGTAPPSVGAIISGNVGIGITNPGQKLEVVGNVSSTGLCLGGTCNTSWPSSGFINPMTTLGDIIYGGASGVATRLGGAAGFLKSTGAVAPAWSALVAADIPSLDASKITTGNLAVARMPTGGNWDLTSNLTVETNVLTVTTGGNVGIGTASPGRKLELYGDRFRINDGSGNYGELFTGPSGGLTATHLGTISNLPLAFFTNSSGPLMTVATSGYIGIGTATPATKLHIVGGGITLENGQSIWMKRNTGGASIDVLQIQAGTDILRIKNPSVFNIVNTSAVSQLYINSSGNVGIGITNPSQKLEIAGNVSSTNAYISGTLTANKVTANLWDPVYDISGTKYATYGLAMTGLKEETAGIAHVTCNTQHATGSMLQDTCSAILDFGKAEKGSDLWLFWQATDFGDNMENLTALLTPSFDGRVWYEKNAAANMLTIFSVPDANATCYMLHGSCEISYRLTANRYDWQNWPNLVSGQKSGMGGPVEKQ